MMTHETEKRLINCYEELARISNYHSDELSGYQRMKISSAYYDLVDIFDKQREDDWNEAMRQPISTPKVTIQ